MELILAGFLFAAILKQLPPEPPDLAGCRLSHGFVVGDDSDERPGAVEIWRCDGRTIVTLNELVGAGQERTRKLRAQISVQPQDGERIVACQEDETRRDYSGLIGATYDKGEGLTALTQAWRADRNSWSFQEVKPTDLTCNRDFAIED